MSLLAPLFMFGAFAIGLPVIFHLVRRSTRERTPFSSLLFLRQSPPRLARRSKLEHLLLLLLRCTAIVLLTAAFARPFFKHDLPVILPPSAPRQTIVLLDASASMRRSSIWEQALQKVSAVLKEASPADSVGVFAFSLHLRPIVTISEWNATPAGERVSMTQTKLAAVSPDWGATHTAQALIQAAEIATDADHGSVPGSARVVLISDMQQGSRLAELQAYDWPAGVGVSVVEVAGNKSSNASIHLALDKDEAAEKRPGTRVRLQNEPSSRKEQFKIGWKSGTAFVGAPVAVYVPAGQNRTIIVPPPPAGTASDRIALEGDEEEFDNTVFVPPPDPTQTTVLYVGADSEEDTAQPLFFIRRAFQETRQQVVRVIAARADQGIPAGTAGAASLFVVTDTLSENAAIELGKLVAAGKAVLFAPKSAAAANVLRNWLSTPSIKLEDIKPANYAMLGEIDFRDPLFEAFADPRFSDFTKIHFWRYRKLEGFEQVSKSRTLAKFENGDAALVEFAIGKGKIYFLASGWQPSDSQLGLSSKFVPLLYSILQQNSVSAPSPLQYFPGSKLIFPAASAGTKPRILSADGKEMALPSDSSEPSEFLSPGLYTADVGNERRRFVVNLEPAESRTTPLPSDELERLGTPIYTEQPAQTKLVARQQRLASAELENKQKLWRWLILGTLGALLVETWLAGRAVRAQVPVLTTHE